MFEGIKTVARHPSCVTNIALKYSCSCYIVYCNEYINHCPSNRMYWFSCVANSGTCRATVELSNKVTTELPVDLQVDFSCSKEPSPPPPGGTNTRIVFNSSRRALNVLLLCLIIPSHNFERVKNRQKKYTPVLQVPSVVITMEKDEYI